MDPVLRLGTRSSPLALWQAEFVADRLRAGGIEVQLETFETTGDKRQEVSLSKIGSKGIFTQELEEGLLDGRIHLAVHSAKDMPSELPEGLELIAFCERETPTDALVSYDSHMRLNSVSTLRLGTSSTRRRALVRRHYPHCTLVEARGNLQTRLRKLAEGEFDALLLAYAGIHRIGQGALVRQHLDVDKFTPPVGQGSVAIEASKSLPFEVREQIRSLCNHPETEVCLAAERAFLKGMNGGCSVPVFGYAQISDGNLRLHGGVVSLDGQTLVEERVAEAVTGLEEARRMGMELAGRVLGGGGRDILMGIRG